MRPSTTTITLRPHHNYHTGMRSVFIQQCVIVINSIKWHQIKAMACNTPHVYRSPTNLKSASANSDQRVQQQQQLPCEKHTKRQI
jgi:hypothetical protein